MFWRVAGFSQPSPTDQILDKEEFTLEELLDEDDFIQECKALNGRLVAFLKERSTVEQLVRLLVEPPKEDDDPKRTYKYPFTSCEVFCCELDAVFDTLLEDVELMGLLFSLLDSAPPLSCKTAGYFGRVVANLLLRKGSQTIQYFKDNPPLLMKLVSHIDTVSVADVIKRMVGADEQGPTPDPAHAQWLSDADLISLLLAKLAHSTSADAQTNAAEILSAIANAQPSPLAAKLANEESVATLFEHALSPSKQVVVSALEVCIALVEPHRNSLEMESLIGGYEEKPQPQPDPEVKAEAVAAIIQHLPKLVEILKQEQRNLDIETTWGQLAQRLGLPRLKIVELFVVLIRSGGPIAEEAVMKAEAIPVCLQLFQTHPFNNMLHHNVAAMLLAILTQSSELILQNLFEQCAFLDWLVCLPILVALTGKGGPEEGPCSPSNIKKPMRAGYMGHATQIGGIVDSISHQASESSSLVPAVFAFSGDVAHPAKVAEYVKGHAGWKPYSDEMLQPQLSLENTSHWECGRPAAGDFPGLDADLDEFGATDMDLEQLTSLTPALSDRYSNMGAEDDDEYEDGVREAIPYADYGLSDVINELSLDDSDAIRYDEDTPVLDAQSADRSAPEAGASGQQATGDDDNVLLASSDDEEAFAAASPLRSKSVSNSSTPAASPDPKPEASEERGIEAAGGDPAAAGVAL
eukprot:gene31784-6983_t